MLFVNNISIIALCVDYSVNVFDMPKLYINSMVEINWLILVMDFDNVIILCVLIHIWL